MSITAIIGAQYGSEGKGKVAAYVSTEYDLSVRSGGPNAGHTVCTDKYKYIFRHIPCAAINEKTELLLAAGAIIDCDVLFEEFRLPIEISKRLTIDSQAVVIGDNDRKREENIQKLIGSTAKGVGAALLRKLARDGTATLARDNEALRPYINDVSERLLNALNDGKRVLLEGTQGMGLSIHHGHYPYVTSRDVSVGSLCGEVGVPPKHVNEIILVVRPYPIRVAGSSGPLEKEISWNDVQKQSGSERDMTEYTTVTGLVRRVGEFDIKEVMKAARINGATSIALTFADHLDARAYGCKSSKSLPKTAVQFIDQLENQLNIPVHLVSTGPHTNHMVDLRKQS